MALDPNVGPALNAASGVLFILLGLIVGLVRPRSGTRVAFAWYAGLFGVWFVVINGAKLVGLRGADRDPTNVVQALAFLGAAVALQVFAVRYARSFGPRSRLAVARSAVVALIVLVPIVTILDPATRAFAEPDLGAGAATTPLVLAMVFVMLAAAWSALHTLAGAYDRATGPTRRRELGFVFSALSLYPSFYFGEIMVVLAAGRGGLYAQAGTTAVGIAWAWLWISWLRVSVVQQDRTARNAALVLVAAAFAGSVIQSLAPAFGGGVGLARTAGVLLMGYALVRHQALGLDLKIKWTLKQSTLAAIFVAVFFAASEGAQALFEDRWGPFVGIGAAAALVFAIHPLQHVAQRVADRAMPGVKAQGEMTKAERRTAYFEAARQAWADGVLSRDERAMLDRMREVLGVAEDEAHQLEREAAQAVGPGGSRSLR